MNVTDILLSGILFIVFIKLCLVKKLRKHSKLLAEARDIKQLRTIWDIPGPIVLPLLGTKWIFMFFYKINKLHEAYADLNRKYGDIVLEVTPAGIPIVHLFGRENIEKVLKYPSKYPFRPPTEIVAYYRQSRPDRYASIGIANEQGERWHHLRSHLTPHMTSPKVLQQFLPALNLICNDFLHVLQTKRDPHTNIVENFQDITNLLGLEAVCALILGRRMGFLATDDSQPDNVRPLAKAVKQLFISQRDSFYGLGLWKYIPTQTYRDFIESEETIYNIISDIIDNTNIEETSSCDHDLKCVFLKILHNDELDLREKKSAMIDFIAAGIETLANSLIFTLCYITKGPTCLKRIRDEFKHSSDSICYDDLSKATYTKACIQEAYRLHPTAFCLARLLEEDTTLSNFQIKAGTMVLCHNMIACRKQQNFMDPDKFMPERWIQNNNLHVCNDPGASLVLPFGTGKRTCPGKRFVGLELSLLIAKLCTSFDIEFKNEMETDCEFLLVAKSPVDIFLKDITM